MKITIIGCGNSGLVHAAKLYEKGHEVALLKTSNTNGWFFDAIEEGGGYEVVDDSAQGKGRRFFVKPSLVTRDVKASISFADVIMVTTITSRHEFVAQLIAPYVRNGQIVVLAPGYMGSLIFKRFINKQIVYCEWETTAYNGRIVDNKYVRISFYNPRNAISVLPVAKTSMVLDVMADCFDNTRYTRKHILESAFHNPNMIVHPIGIIFSASRIEYSNGEFWMYREAFTPSVINVIKAFDIVKNRVLEAFGCAPLDYFEAAKWRNEEDLSVDAMTVFRAFADSSNKGPSSIDHRYLTEDVPMGMGLFISVAKILGEDTSVPEGIVSLASALLKRDLGVEARTIQKLLGKDEVSIADIQKAIIG